MSTKTATQLPLIGTGKITGAQVWADDSDGLTSRLPVAKTQVADTLAARDTNGATALAGVQFPAAQVASSDANMLDDYEEGTWNPVVSGSSTAGSPTYGTRLGLYTKIGNLVTFQLYVELATLGGAAGNLQISLPMAAKSVASMKYSVQVGQIGSITHAAGYTEFAAIITSGASVIQMLENGSNNAGTNVTIANTSATAFFSLAGSYMTT